MSSKELSAVLEEIKENQKYYPYKSVQQKKGGFSMEENQFSRSALMTANIRAYHAMHDSPKILCDSRYSRRRERRYAMLVTMKRQVFDSLENEALGWKCIEPTIQQMHSEKGYQIRFQIFEQLTTGQRAQFMFRVLYGHARKGVVEFFRIAQFYSEVAPSVVRWDAW